MLGALGGFGFKAASLLLFGEIGLGDGYRARDEQNQRQCQREKADGRGQAVKRRSRAGRAADAAGRILRLNRHDANGAARYGRPVFRHIVGEMERLWGTAAADGRGRCGDRFKQPIDLLLRLFNRAARINDGVCTADFFIQRHLRIDAALSLFAAQSVAFKKTLNLRFTIRTNHPNSVEQRFHAAFVQQRDIADDDLPGRVELIKLTADFRKNHRVQNGVERFPFLRVGKDELAEFRTVERCAGKYAVAECLADFGQRRAALRRQCARNRVRIDDLTTLLFEMLADGAFSAGNRTG